jgi:anthranilate 3-monooxygenase (FAD) / 4-hydroxyphenylacetate 3-monooxygenase
MSFLTGQTDEEMERRRHAEEIRCEMTFGLMGRMPDFVKESVTDAAAFMEIPSRRGRHYSDKLERYHLDRRENN